MIACSPIQMGFDSDSEYHGCNVRLWSIVVSIVARHIHGWIFVEKTIRHPVKAGIDDRLHRPVFGSRPVMVVQRMPDHDVLVVDAAVGPGPFWQAIAARMLIWKPAGWIEFIGGVTGYPEVLVHERGALAYR